MSFTKFASLESAEVLGVRGSSERVRTATLDKFSDFDKYRTEDGYLYARIRAISSRVNKNHDGWPSVELAGNREIFDRHLASESSFTVAAEKGAEFGYSTFLGKPVFVDHHNSDPSRARGVIVDAKLHVEDAKTASGLDSYYSSAPDNHLPPTWVELLLEVDAKSFPKLAQAILDGSKNSKRGIDGFSMGCDVEKTQCNICRKFAHSPDEYCEHIRLKGAHFDHVDPNSGRKVSKKSYEDCYGIKFFEISAVFDPADETALLRELIHKEASEGSFDEDRVGLDSLDAARGLRERTADDSEAYNRWLENNNPRDLDRIEECPRCHAGGIGFSDHGRYCSNCGYDESEITPAYDPDAQPGGHDFNSKSSKTAEAPLPQSDMLHAPQEINTLREEQVCPVCGSTMDDETCDLCGYIEPPEGFDNPDLQKAQETEEQGDIQNLEETPSPPAPGGDTSLAEPDIGRARNNTPTANVKGDMAKWNISFHPKVAGRINTTESPITTSTDAATDEPKEEILKDETAPTTARTAKEFIAAANRKENNMDKQAAEPVPAAKPDKRVEVEGVGGVEDASNEQASKADKQVSVDEMGGTGVEDVSADQENVSVAQGDEHSKNVEEIPTKTWSGTEGQTDPVQGDVFPTASNRTAYDSESYPKDDGGLSGGSAAQGTQPADPVGKADDRVDVLDAVTSPANNSGPTKTWNGTDGNGVTRQQDPVTNETLEGDNIVNLNPGTTSKHLFSAFKLADLEVELGLLTGDKKYDRVAELEKKTPERVAEALEYAQRIKTAGLGRRKEASVRKLPSLAKTPAPKTSSGSDSEWDDDSVLFG